MAADEDGAHAQVNIQASVRIQPVPQFNPDTEVGASLATRWSTWLDDFEMFLLASAVTDKKQKRALLYTRPVREFVRYFDNSKIQETMMTTIQLKVS